MPTAEEERPEDNQSDLTDDAEGQAFDEPYQSDDEEQWGWEDNVEQDGALEDAKIAPKMQKPNTVMRESVPWTSVLYRFLTHRKTDDGFMISDRERSKR